ncbi:ABC transporter substrate-binding protein, partial [bacterium]|nr:ABC transporter substrate-binding protein [bacterium]
MKLFLGLDDTDIPGSPGTNQIAMALGIKLKELGIETHIILRHQL